MLLKKRFVKLKTLCAQIRGVSYTPKDVRDTPAEGYLPILRANNIQDKITLDDLVYVNHKKIGAEQLLKEGDILICASSGSKNLVGKAAMVHDLAIQPASFGAFCKVVRPVKIYAPYVAHFFNSSYYRNTISHIAQGANINNIRNEHINDLDIPYPDQKEQKRIAERLDKVQELIALQKEQLKKLDKLIKSRFIDLFGDPIRDEKEFKKDILGVGITILSDYHANGSYEILKQHVELLSKPDYALMIRTTDLENKNYTDGVNYITEKAYNFLEKSKIYGGEIIINKIGSAGKIYFMPYLNRPVSLGMNAFLLRFDKKLLNNVFVYYMLGTNSITTEIQKRVKGAVTKTITKDAIRELPIIYPPIELQNKFADFVTKIEAQKGLLTTRLSHLETLYKSLMQECFG